LAEKKEQIHNPVDVKELLDMKAVIDKNSAKLFSTKRYRQVIEDLQKLKVSIMWIPGCRI